MLPVKHLFISFTGGALMNNLLEYLKWALALILAFSLGVLVVNYLVVSTNKRKVYAIASMASLLATIILFIFSFRGWQLVTTIGLFVIVFITGWMTQTKRILSQNDPRFLPELARAEGASAAKHTAVIYLTHGEPKHYDPVGWINTFRELDKGHVKFIPFIARPFFFNQLRKCYLTVGCSNHRETHISMVKSLEQVFRTQGDLTTRFYLCFLDDDPRPDAAVIQALNEGADRIVVSLVFLTVSNHTAEGLHMVKSVDTDKFGVPIAVTTPLWDSLTLRNMFLARANASLDGCDKSDVGIMLVGHGQPDEWDKEFPTETEQEARFREEILRLFEKDGYKKENLGSAWMSFKEPKPARLVEEMVKRGVKKILYFASAISADSLHSQHDVPELMHQAHIPQDFPLVNLGAWNDDPMVIQAIKERVDALMAISKE
jgi:protoheme ferro-lyase